MLETSENLQALQDEIELLIRYAVPEEEQGIASEYLCRFTDDAFAFGVIRDFYRTLPDANEEALLRISVIEEKEQVYLLLLSTANHHHIYLTNDEEGLFLGEWEQGLRDKQILKFFGYPDTASFKSQHDKVDACREYIPLERMDEDLCPSCGVQSGGLHTFGCPVEVCPWCGGQLNHCNCRFEQLEVEELQDEARLKELQEKLEKKGRVPYAKEQRPTFLSESGDTTT
jgi:hypothetical protein